jgi:hypothetical protein
LGVGFLTRTTNRERGIAGVINQDDVCARRQNDMASLVNANG